MSLMKSSGGKHLLQIRDNNGMPDSTRSDWSTISLIHTLSVNLTGEPIVIPEFKPIR